jgi:hypothetical protein
MQVFLTILCLTTEVELYYINTTRCGLAILKKCEHQILVRVLRYTVKSQNKLGFLVWRGRLQELRRKDYRNHSLGVPSLLNCKGEENDVL